ncbi:hypothetical protein DMUE_5491 [Dictyocoela muelleri]|nr:hypothetical protein DMUE_5491 [Dictyocoela muelleri]
MESHKVNIDEFTKLKKSLKCFECGKPGHKKVDCYASVYKTQYNMVMNDKYDSDSLREEEIRINSRKSYCVFDSGSSFNIITLIFLNKLEYDKNSINRTDKKAILVLQRLRVPPQI